MKILQLKAQIAAIENNIKQGKAKNIFAASNKVRTLKLELMKEESRVKFENYLAQ